MEDKHAALSEMDKSNIERELQSLGSSKEVEDDLARLKRDLGMA
jgi:phage shock protein A